MRHVPDDLPSHERLAFILDLEGRRWESQPHLWEQVRHGEASYSVLIRLGSRESAVSLPEELKKVRLAQPHSATVVLADAVIALDKKHTAKAEALLRKAIAKQPALLEAHARLGRLLADQDMSRLPDWERELPAGAESHPDVWVVRGLWAQSASQHPAAIRCHWEAARRDPNHRIANYQLSQLLTEAEDQTAAAEFAERAARLQELAVQMTRLTTDSSDLAAMKSAAGLLEQLGRYWEASGWWRLILAKDPAQTSPRDAMQNLQARLSESLPLTDPARNPAGKVDFSKHPLPRWPESRPNAKPARPETAGVSHFRFVDRAAEAGLDFTYFNGHATGTEGTRMYGFSGGGVAVLDYDQDGWPDLYFTQGCPWPPQKESARYRDRLFRNQEGGRFQDVTQQTGLGDGFFSQGVTVGDFNSDGWPDLYLANIGQNRLYQNNGDGTFRDVSAEARLSGTEWTTSCLLADLNGDGHPDLYDVNYVGGDDVFERLCLVEGRLRACPPAFFPAQRDRIFLSDGQGAFRAFQGLKAAVLDPARPGLGIVAADMDGSGRLSLFVANDAVANAFLINETPAGSGRLGIRENALLAGLAFDRNGRGQASMGVAAGDADGNGLLDFFVTNDYAEANAMYLQITPGAFEESSRSAGLYNDSLWQLGFGTQFLDGDLDGRLDLVATNGHFDDFRYRNIPYQMRPQFFANEGSGRFQLVSPKNIGPFFDRKGLGRGLALLDWNRDGLPDFAVSHINSPAAIVTNETSTASHWLKIRLVGVQSPRDALGTRAIVTNGRQSWTRQLTAGDGYQASNERVLLFGLGDSPQADQLQIQWPSGRRQQWENIPADQEWLIVETAQNLFRLSPKK